MSNNHFIWDIYSDQPKVIKDRAFKKATRRKELKDNLKLLFTSIFILPISIIIMKFFKGNVKSSNIDFIGLGVNLDKDDGKNTQQDLVQELGVKNLIIRLPLSDIKNIDLIFDKFKDISNEFQIGTTINRLKWGFFSTEEFMNFYMVASKIKEDKYPNIKLLGPSVIDFEYYYNARAMFNLKKIKYDITSALLYVDRRGAPQNSQYGIFDLKNKIDMLFSLVKMSPKTLSDDIYITEVNWPISNTAPYAPTSEKECVSCDDYTKYMLDYFKIAQDSKKIKRVYWHQLIAPGYGLVNNRDGKILKYPQFYVFKELLQKK